MNCAKMERFLPNECYVCKSRDNLIRCDCNLISYCSEAHRLNHLPIHKSFCKLIKSLLIAKKLSHIYEELTNLPGPEWNTKRCEIYAEIKSKLGRRLSPLEYVMFHRQRVCFVCCKTEKEELTNCPNCPVASFCENHPHDELHSINCKVMNQYLKILNVAEELNVDLEFLSSSFPCLKEEREIGVMGKLTRTFIVKDMKLDCLKSRLLKNGLIQFMDVASKVQNALQKIYGRIPEEIVIHVDAFFSTHAITRVNYWEFFMHLNPMVRKLKIVIVLNRILNNKLENCSLCESCSSKEKELSVKFLAKSYDDFMLDENYQKPNILFYVQVEECNSEKVKKWSEFNFPVVLRFESDSNFSKTPQFLALSTKFRFIYDGQIKAPFSTLSSIENKDYFIIFQSKENKGKSFDLVTGENCGEKIGTSTIETSSIVEDINSENLNSAENIADVLKITSSELNDNSDSNEKSKVETKGNQSAIVSLPEANVKDNSENLNSAENIANASKIHSSESKDNSDNNEKLKLETKENLAVTVYLPEANRILIQNENTNTETEVEKNSNNKKTELTENKNSNIPAEPAVHTSNDEQKEQKFEDKIFSPSSSLICPLVIISKPEEEEKEKKEEEVEKNTAIENSKHEENNCSNSKSIDNESLEIEDDEEKNEEKNNTELIEKLRVEKEEQKNNIEFRVNLENFSYSQTNFSQSFLIDHISYLNHENEELRKRLNASIEEVAKQQIKFEQIFSTVIEENKLMKKVLRDIVNIADIDLQLKKS